MPIYEYVCESCNKQQEIIQKFSEKPLKSCPLCHKEDSMRKILSNSSFHLKGSGWYKDLYSSAKSDAPASKSKKE